MLILIGDLDDVVDVVVIEVVIGGYDDVIVLVYIYFVGEVCWGIFLMDVIFEDEFIEVVVEGEYVFGCVVFYGDGECFFCCLKIEVL